MKAIIEKELRKAIGQIEDDHQFETYLTSKDFNIIAERILKAVEVYNQSKNKPHKINKLV